MTEPKMFEVPAPASRPCCWCGADTHGTLEIEPARMGVDKTTGTRVVKKAAIIAPCCFTCARRLVPSEAPVGA